MPKFTAAPGASEGRVGSCDADELLEEAEGGDFVVSRTNAPLIKLAYTWLKEGRRCRIQGKDIGGGLATWIRNSGAASVPALMRNIDAWEDGEVARLTSLDRPTETVTDKADCLRSLCEGMTSIDSVLHRIEYLFANNDDGTGQIVLSSTHRAKGLERERVWLLRDTYCRWEGQDELNLLYVGITRAKNELVYVHGLGGTKKRAA